MWAISFNPEADAPALPDQPAVILVFGPADTLRDTPCLAALHSLYPGAIHLGCSTGTMVADAGMVEQGLRALAIGFAATPVALHTQPLADAGQSREAGRRLAESLAAPDLAGVFLLSVGLGVNGSDVVDGMRDVLGPDFPISGGLAGDGERFGDTLVAIDGVARSGIIAALTMTGNAIRISHGCHGGWHAFGPRRVITASDGAVLHQLDGTPALDLYEKYLGEEAAGLPASGLLFPLKIWDPAQPDMPLVRTLLGVDRDTRSLVLAGNVPEGWQAQLMRSTTEDLIDAAAIAARNAAAAMAHSGAAPELCLFVSCVGRRLVLGQRTEEEIEAVSEVIGAHVPLSGFYSYGEIAPLQRDAAAGLHNQTVTLTLLGEVA